MCDSTTSDPTGPLRYLQWTNALVVQREANVKVRLFCLPFAGGGASVFRDWPRKLPQSIQVIPLQLPGRESRWNEPPCEEASELVARLAAGLGPILDLPFSIFGHSMGAMVAFELARALESEGHRPLRLFISAVRPPQDPDPDPPMHQLTDAELISRVTELNGIPQMILDRPDLIALILPALRADLKVYETYKYRAAEPLDCPVSVYGGYDDTKAPPNSLVGWRIQTQKDFTTRLFPGDHFFLETARDALLQQILTDLMRSLRCHEAK